MPPRIDWPALSGRQLQHLGQPARPAAYPAKPLVHTERLSDKEPLSPRRTTRPAPRVMLSVDRTGQYRLDIDYRGAVQRLQGRHPQACRLVSFQHVHAV